jgi:DNA-binding NarL/FixJ family response regulator
MAGDLTNREKQVLKLISRGLSNKEIAGCLAIGLSTVQNHIHSILQKMGAASRVEAAVLAIQQNTVPDGKNRWNHL